MAATRCIHAYRHGQDHLLKFTTGTKMVKEGDLQQVILNALWMLVQNRLV